MLLLGTSRLSSNIAPESYDRVAHALYIAIPFLLLLAIADDALVIVILAVFHSSGPLSIPALVVFTEHGAHLWVTAAAAGRA